MATPNDEKQYSFELDVAESANDFGQLSGTYSIVCGMLTDGVCDGFLIFILFVEYGCG